jgi:multiple sugar transport system substrate-binding protein
MKKLQKCLLVVSLILGLLLALVLQGFTQETVVLRFLTAETDPECLDAYQTIIGMYTEEHPNVNIILELATYDDLKTVLAQQMTAGNAADIINADTSEIATFSKLGYLYQLDDIISDIGVEDFKSGSIFKIGDHYYSLPYAGDGDVLWIRNDLIEKYGTKKPETWDEWLQYSEKMTIDSDGDGQIDIFGSVVPAGLTGKATDMMQEITWAAGGQEFDRNFNVVYDSPESIQAVEFLGKLAKFSPPGISSYSYWEVIEAFVTGRSAIAIYMGRVLGQLETKAPELLDVADVVLLPKGPKFQCNYLNWNSYAVTSKTPFPEEAKDFLKFLITGDRAVIFCNTVPGHMVPALFSINNNPKLYEPEVLQRRPDIAKVLLEDMPAHGGGIGCAGQIYEGQFTYGIINPFAGAVRGDNVLPKVLQNHLIGGMSAEEAVKWGDARLKEIKEQFEELFDVQ